MVPGFRSWPKMRAIGLALSLVLLSAPLFTEAFNHRGSYMAAALRRLADAVQKVFLRSIPQFSCLGMHLCVSRSSLTCFLGLSILATGQPSSGRDVCPTDPCGASFHLSGPPVPELPPQPARQGTGGQPSRIIVIPSIETLNVVNICGLASITMMVF